MSAGSGGGDVGERQQPQGCGAVVFMTGLSGAGKSTIAAALAEQLQSEARPVAIIDGDDLRRGTSADLGYDRASREANIERAAMLAADAARDGRIVITALIAPFEAARQRARQIVDASGSPFLLVFVRTPLAVAEARDVKGLYRRARAGEIADFTGITSPFEEPTDADVVIDTTVTSVADAVAQIRAAVDRAQTATP